MKTINTIFFCLLLFSCGNLSEKNISSKDKSSDFSKFLDLIPDMRLPFHISLEDIEWGSTFRASLKSESSNLTRDENEFRLKHKFLQIPYFTRMPPDLHVVGKFKIQSDKVGVICVSDYGGGVGIYLRVFNQNGNNLDVIQLGGNQVSNNESGNWKKGGFLRKKIDRRQLVSSISSDQIIKQDTYEFVELDEPVPLEGGGYIKADLQLTSTNHYKIDQAGKFKLTNDFYAKG